MDVREKTASEKRLIDATKWDEFYQEMTKDLKPYDHYDDGYRDAMDNVDDWMDGNQVEAEPVRHGRWIFGKDLPYNWGQIPKNKYHLYCSECLEQSFNRSEDNDPDFDVDTPYCPFCGCCMDGGVDE